MTLADLILTCSDLPEIVARFGRRPTCAEWEKAGLAEDSYDLLTPETCATPPEWAHEVLRDEGAPYPVTLTSAGYLISRYQSEPADTSSADAFRAQVRRFSALSRKIEPLHERIADLRAAMAAQAQAYRDMGAAIETMSAVVCDFLSEPLGVKQPSAIVQARATLAQSRAKAVLDAANQATQDAWWQAHDALAKMEAP